MYLTCELGGKRKSRAVRRDLSVPGWPTDINRRAMGGLICFGTPCRACSTTLNFMCSSFRGLNSVVV